MAFILVGSATNLILCPQVELDLSCQYEVEAFFASEKPEFVILAMAKAGGIHAYNTHPADFIAINLKIQTNIIDSTYHSGIKNTDKLLMFYLLCGLEHLNVGSGKEITIKELLS
ncbi:hypothetical protein TanjilG_28198 [Lupinus angustifolius]|uniref:NAD-dependent epimerase/dehydratase domain-containing protein n=1 Tax=Lupinus angustifolius TaxID=3871 RepID=A0A4P1REN8_LUPAN|nr:hypothetical protein TanjilG_28198 [Lupinus angustifolius]